MKRHHKVWKVAWFKNFHDFCQELKDNFRHHLPLDRFERLMVCTPYTLLSYQFVIKLRDLGFVKFKYQRVDNVHFLPPLVSESARERIISDIKNHTEEYEYSGWFAVENSILNEGYNQNWDDMEDDVENYTSNEIMYLLYKNFPLLSPVCVPCSNTVLTPADPFYVRRNLYIDDMPVREFAMMVLLDFSILYSNFEFYFTPRNRTKDFHDFQEELSRLELEIKRLEEFSFRFGCNRHFKSENNMHNLDNEYSVKVTKDMSIDDKISYYSSKLNFDSNLTPNELNSTKSFDQKVLITETEDIKPSTGLSSGLDNMSNFSDFIDKNLRNLNTKDFLSNWYNQIREKREFIDKEKWLSCPASLEYVQLVARTYLHKNDYPKPGLPMRFNDLDSVEDTIVGTDRYFRIILNYPRDIVKLETSYPLTFYETSKDSQVSIYKVQGDEETWAGFFLVGQEVFYMDVKKWLKLYKEKIEFNVFIYELSRWEDYQSSSEEKKRKKYPFEDDGLDDSYIASTLDYFELLNYNLGFGTLLLATKYGVLTRDEALQKKVGGIVLGFIY